MSLDDLWANVLTHASTEPWVQRVRAGDVDRGKLQHQVLDRAPIPIGECIVDQLACKNVFFKPDLPTEKDKLEGYSALLYRLSKTQQLFRHGRNTLMKQDQANDENLDTWLPFEKSSALHLAMLAHMK